MFQRLFYGRNGIDPLSVFLMCLAVPFIGFRHYFIWVIGVALIVYALFRCFSRNVEKRRQEQYAFNNGMQKVAYAVAGFFNRIRPFFHRIGNFFSTMSMRWKQRKEYVFVRCPRCKKTLRLPRHKGKIIVTCTVCRYEFKKKT